MLAQRPRVPCITGALVGEEPPPDEAAAETSLTDAEILELTLRFLFGDPSGVKATGPTGAARRATLELIVKCDAVKKSLWPSRRPEIKALMADEQGRFDMEELLAHIINNALGRPLLVRTDARGVGTQANNALKKEKLETAAAKAQTGGAISDARAAARADPARLPEVAAAEAARKAALAAVLAQEYDLQLPNVTVGAKRKREAVPDPFVAVELAERALAQAEGVLKSAKHFYDGLGPQPPLEYPEDLDDDDGARAAERLWEREAEIRGRAGRDVMRLNEDVSRLAAARAEACRVRAAASRAAGEAEMRRVELAEQRAEQRREQRLEEGRERERLLREEVRARVPHACDHEPNCGLFCFAGVAHCGPT